MKNLIGVLLCLMACQMSLLACAPLDGNGDPVTVSREAAIIVWDAAKHRQHFIRRASFVAKSQDVGFLVPTPSTPDLAEADDMAFNTVAELIQPEIIEVNKRTWRWSFFGREGNLNLFSGVEEPADASAGPAHASTGPVEVIREQHVAGYDAVVLAAEDVNGLGRWLKVHGYQSSPPLLKWLKPYVQKRWKITAFKIAKADKNSGEISSAAVRMSFDTPRPFFPYSEPQNEKPAPGERWLQVLTFAPQRLAGFQGGAENAAPWKGQVEWAGSLSPTKQAGLAKSLGLPQTLFAAPQWLTVFNDYSSPRKGSSDVFFVPDEDQSSVLPPPIIKYKTQTIMIPIDVIAMLWLFGYAVWIVSQLRRS